MFFGNCGCCGSTQCPCVRGQMPGSVIVEVTNEDRTIQYSLSTLAGTGNTIFALGTDYYNQCLAWSFGSLALAQADSGDWIQIRLLVKVSTINEPPPASVDDYIVQRCRSGEFSCPCIVELTVFQRIASPYVIYDQRGDPRFAFSSTSAAPLDLVGFSASVPLYRQPAVGQARITEALFSIIGQE